MNLLEALSAKIVKILGEKYFVRNIIKGVYRALIGTYKITVNIISIIIYRNTL